MAQRWLYCSVCRPKTSAGTVGPRTTPRRRHLHDIRLYSRDQDRNSSLQYQDQTITSKSKPRKWKHCLEAVSRRGISSRLHITDRRYINTATEIWFEVWLERFWNTRKDGNSRFEIWPNDLISNVSRLPVTDVGRASVDKQWMFLALEGDKGWEEEGGKGKGKR